MTTPPDTFGAIRSLLQAPPSRESWDALCELLEKVDARELERTFAYAASLLERWPDTLRVGGRGLLWAEEGTHSARLQPLCRTLDFSNMRGTLRYYVGRGTPSEKPMALDMAKATRLDLSTSQETFSDIGKLMTLAGMRSLREIDLSKSKRMRGNGDDAIDALGDAIANMTSPIALDLTKVDWAKRTLLERLFERAGEKIASLSLSQSKQNGQTLPALARAKGGALRGIDLSRNRVCEHFGVDAMMKSGILNQLEHLDLNRNDLRARNLRPMLDLLAPRVRTLGLTEVRRSDLVRDALQSNISFPYLRALAVDTEGLPPSLDAPSLTELELYPNGETVYDLPKHPVFSRLTRLVLRRGQDRGSIEGICARADLSSLRSIELDDVAASGTAIEGLARNPTASRVERVRIVRPSMLNASSDAFASLLELESLRELEFERVTHGSGELAGLLSSPKLSMLQTLSLLDCSLTDSPIHSLFHNEALTRLELLRFRQTSKLSDVTLEMLVDPPHVPRHWRPSNHILETRARRLREKTKKVPET